MEGGQAGFSPLKLLRVPPCDHHVVRRCECMGQGETDARASARDQDPSLFEMHVCYLKGSRCPPGAMTARAEAVRAPSRYRSEMMCNTIDRGARKVGTSAKANTVKTTIERFASKICMGPTFVVAPRPMATMKPSRPNTFQAIADERPPGLRRPLATNGAARPAAMSPRPAGSANNGGSLPRASRIRKLIPRPRHTWSATRLACVAGWSISARSDGSAVAAIHVVPSPMRNAIGTAGIPVPDAGRYTPATASAAVAASHVQSAAPTASGTPPQPAARSRALLRTTVIAKTTAALVATTATVT